MAYSGVFKLKNPKKYIGDSSNVIFRSLKERSIMNYCDTSDKVISWCSEEIVVPYIYEVDRKEHRYFVDFLVKIKTNSGTVVDLLIEYKPKSQTVAPKKPKKRTSKAIQNYNNAAMTWIKNCNKWKAAELYAKNMGAEFVVLHEEHIDRMNFFKTL